MFNLAALPDRAVLAITGVDRVPFLNGLVSNDVAQAAPRRAIWTALLTPQGKWLADFFVFAETDRLLLECEAAQSTMITTRLARYRLRADATIAPTDLHVYAGWGDSPAMLDEPLVAPDPRLPAAGVRLLSTAAPPTNASRDQWDLHRLALGLPDGSRDLETEKTVLLEAGFDELHGVSWSKGCYMGQELTARTRYRGLIKKRLLPVSAAGIMPPPGTPILAGAREVGQMRSSNGALGLALLRLDALAAPSLLADDQPLTVKIPTWARLPEAA